MTLTAGEQNLDIDFGYTGSGVIGDTVWFDVDPDGTGALTPDGIQNPGEIGIANVTLYICTGDTDPCNAGTAGVITVTTGADGKWLQSGLTAGNVYTVAADTSTLPANFNPNPTNGQLRKVFTLPATGSYLHADYGFTDNQNASQDYGTIGGQIYHDLNGDGFDDAGADPGIGGIVVELISGGTVIATTTTDAGGNYRFSGLVLNTAYSVRIKDGTDILSTMTRTETGPVNDTYTFTPTTANPNQNGADFGFTGSTSDIGDYVWFDLNGDGVEDANEAGMGNVAMDLYLDIGTNAGVWDAGDLLVRSTLTDSDGSYLFSGIETGHDYIVKAAIPTNFSPSPLGSDNVGNAAGEYPFTFNATTLAADFGLQGGNSSIGTHIWYDKVRDQSWDAGDAPIENVTLALYLGDVLIGTTITDVNGEYSFGSLPNNTYRVVVTDQNNVLRDMTLTTPATTGDSVVINNGDQVGIDFGYDYPTPTYAAIASFAAYLDEAGSTTLEWTTSSELGTIGFMVERLDRKSGKYRKVSRNLLTARLAPPHGATYRLQDPLAVPGREYTYRLLEIAANDLGGYYGPFTVQATQKLVERRDMAADSRPGYSLSTMQFSNKQLSRFDAHDTARISLAQSLAARTGSTLKIPVRTSGIFYLATTELAQASGISAAEITADIKQQNCFMELNGEEVASIAANNGSGIWFYGQAPASDDITYNLYRITLGQPGQQVDTDMLLAAEPAAAGQGFTAKVKAEENLAALHFYTGEPVQDLWAWEYLFAYGGDFSVSHTFDAPGLQAADTAVLKVNMVAVSNQYSGAEQPFTVSIRLNNVELGAESWTAAGDYQLSLSVPPDTLLPEGNEVVITSQLQNGVTWSFMYLNSVELAYSHDYQLVNGQLKFIAGNYETVTVSGLNSRSSLVLDVTDPLVPVRIRPLISKNQAGEYSITLNTVPGNSYFVTTNYGVAVTDPIVADLPSNLKDGQNGADYLIITAAHLRETAQRLADYRQSQGLTPMIVDIEDIHDEFSFGTPTVRALADFLAYAHTNWQLAPEYVVLIGDGSFDYQNYLGYGDPVAPAMLVRTADGYFATDNGFADLDDDGVPEFALGRIPVVDAVELDSYISKLIAYESTAPARPTATIVVDKLDPAAGDFAASGQLVNTAIPDSWQRDLLEVDSSGATAVHSDILSGFQQGTDLFHFVGHSSFVSIGANNGTLLSDTDIEAGSFARPAMMTSMSCSAGNFGYPAMASLAETAVLKADGGAVSFFAPSGLSRNYQADLLATGYYDALFDGQSQRLGDVIIKAKQHYLDQGGARYMLDIYNLLGDPAALVPAAR